MPHNGYQAAASVSKTDMRWGQIRRDRDPAGTKYVTN